MAAVITGFVIYLAIPIFLYHIFHNVFGVQLFCHERLCCHWIIGPGWSFLGFNTVKCCWGITRCAPRTLQALAKDRILFPFFAKSTGDQKLPRRATVASYFIALITLLLGDLNSIAMVLSMFSLPLTD
ncbi:MAG: hypothetical protein R3A45_03195 [Bdellovibrionota bacterium]